MAESSNPFDDMVRELVVFKHENPDHPGGQYVSNSPMWMDARVRQHWLARYSDSALAAKAAKAAGQTPEPTPEDEVPDYSQWTNDDLRAELVQRNLSVEGKKADMVARLEQDDKDNPEE